MQSPVDAKGQQILALLSQQCQNHGDHFVANCCTVEDLTIFGDSSWFRPTQTKLSEKVSQISSFRRLSFSGLSSSSSMRITEDLAHSFGPGLYAFQLNGLRAIAKNFSSDFLLGEGGFGSVHKGYINNQLLRGLKAQAVAVKLLNNDDGLQGHHEWLVINFLSFHEEIIVTKQGTQFLLIEHSE